MGPDYGLTWADVAIDLKPVVKLKAFDRICEWPIVAVAGFASRRKIEIISRRRSGGHASFTSSVRTAMSPEPF